MSKTIRDTKNSLPLGSIALQAKKMVTGSADFMGFANAVIGMVAGADRFIGLDGAGPKEPAAPKTTARPHCDPDVNQPEGPDQ